MKRLDCPSWTISYFVNFLQVVTSSKSNKIIWARLLIVRFFFHYHFHISQQITINKKPIIIYFLGIFYCRISIGCYLQTESGCSWKIFRRWIPSDAKFIHFYRSFSIYRIIFWMLRRMERKSMCSINGK